MKTPKIFRCQNCGTRIRNGIYCKPCIKALRKKLWENPRKGA